MIDCWKLLQISYLHLVAIEVIKESSCVLLDHPSSGKQLVKRFHTMSTAESELVGYCEATTMLKSAEALLKVIHGPCAVDEVFDK